MLFLLYLLIQNSSGSKFFMSLYESSSSTFFIFKVELSELKLEFSSLLFSFLFSSIDIFVNKTEDFVLLKSFSES